MKRENNWRQKTIENLEGRCYSDPIEAPTNLIKRCLELCKVSLEKFTVEDLRLMIGQQFAPTYLIPLALEHLSKDILIDGDLYRGDLLENVLNVDTHFWNENLELWTQLNDLISSRREEIDSEIIVSSKFDASKHSKR